MTMLDISGSAPVVVVGGTVRIRLTEREAQSFRIDCRTQGDGITLTWEVDNEGQAAQLHSPLALSNVAAGPQAVRQKEV